MSVDNPEQILTLLQTKTLLGELQGRDYREHDDTVRKEAIAALDAYYKAQASKDMAEVIGEDEYHVKDSERWRYLPEYLIAQDLRAAQRKTAASKGYKVE